MSSADEYPTTSLRGGNHALVAIFIFMPLACLLIHICLAVRKADRRSDPDIEDEPGYAAAQHETPPPYREFEELQLGLDVVAVDVACDYRGYVNVGWSYVKHS